VLFGPSKPEIGPFPTDFLTAPSTTSNTARRVRMPAPADCAATPNTCQEHWLLEQFDGFSLYPRVRVRFSAAINPETLKDGVYLVARDNYTTTEPGIHKTGDVVRLNQFIYDPVNFAAYAKPDAAMDQHRRYALVVTDAVKDEAGDPVEADSAYSACAEGAADDYCRTLSEAVKAITEAKIAGASVFSTLSATQWLEKARDLLADTPPAPTPAADRPFFPLAEVAGATWRRQIRTDPVEFDSLEFPPEFLALLADSVRGLGFGTIDSPGFLDSTRAIPAGDPVATGVEKIAFHSYLPRRDKPEAGYPVVIYGHGASDSRFGGPSVLALALSSEGFATVAINAVGHGFGPRSSFDVRLRTGDVIAVPAPGRGVDSAGDTFIGDSDGCGANFDSPFGLRDCMRQTTVDLLQLVRAIRAGIDVDGDGVPDFDPERIYYIGQSLGSIYGSMFLALDPHVKIAALNSGGGTVTDIARWSPAFRPESELRLAFRTPALATPGTPVDEQYVLRNQPVRVVEDPKAIEIQNTVETGEWLQAEGDAASFVAHLKTSPLTGVPAKTVLWQFAWGDQTVPNPAQSALVRLANMKDATWVYRHDVARGVSPNLGVNPHTYLTDILSFFTFPIARATQAQIVNLFATGNIVNPNGNLSLLFGQDLFVQPETLPEELNFIEP
jgi:hypothetical protein